jgi:hypothetical protein
MKKPSLLRSIDAIFLGFLAVVVLSLGTDQVLHVLWYLIAIAATAVPCAWIGGALYRPSKASN